VVPHAPLHRGELPQLRHVDLRHGGGRKGGAPSKQGGAATRRGQLREGEQQRSKQRDSCKSVSAAAAG
jgi:hypothetical protein